MNRLGIKKGAIVGARHFDPMMVRLIQVTLEMSPELDDDTVWITCGADSHEIGLHANFRAWDIRTRNITAPDLNTRRQIAAEWARKVRERVDTQAKMKATRPSWSAKHRPRRRQARGRKNSRADLSSATCAWNPSRGCRSWTGWPRS